MGEPPMPLHFDLDDGYRTILGSLRDCCFDRSTDRTSRSTTTTGGDARATRLDDLDCRQGEDQPHAPGDRRLLSLQEFLLEMPGQHQVIVRFQGARFFF